MKRVLAAVAAGLLIALALAVRAAIDDDDSSGGGNGGGDDPSDVVIGCVRELRAACETLRGNVQVADPAATIGDPEVDVWVTFDPWPDIAALQERTFAGQPVPVASTDLVLLVRRDTVPDACDDPPDWVCVTELERNAAAALPTPPTALGALLLGHAALGWSAIARPGESFATQDLDLPEFTAWVDRLRFAGNPLADMLQLWPAGPGAVGTTRAAVRSVVEVSSHAADVTPVRTGDGTVAVVVVGDRAADIADNGDFLDALGELGYDLDPDATSTGLPSPGVLLALTQEIR